MPWGAPRRAAQIAPTSSSPVLGAGPQLKPYFTLLIGVYPSQGQKCRRGTASPLFPPGSPLISAQREPAVSMGTVVGSAGLGIAPSRPSTVSDPTGNGRIRRWRTSHRSGSRVSSHIARPNPSRATRVPLRHRPGWAGHCDWPPSPSAWPRAPPLGFSLAQPRGCPAIRSCEGRP